MPHILGFGKHIGKNVDNVPFTYLKWLTHWRVQPVYTCDHEKPEGVEFCDTVNDLLEVLVGNADFYLRDEVDKLDPESPLKNPDWWMCLARSTDPLTIVWAHAEELDKMQVRNGFSPRYVKSLYTFFQHRDAVDAARAAMIARRVCFACGDPIRPIADRRSNGVDHHRDWDGRLLHKKCFVKIMREN